MTTAVVQHDAEREIISQYEKTWKPGVLAAIDENGGSLIVRVNGPSIGGRDIHGLFQRRDGDSTLHEFVKTDVKDDRCPMVFAYEIYNYLEVVDHNVENQGDQRRQNQVLLNNGSVKVNKIDVFTNDTLTGALKKQMVQESKVFNQGPKPTSVVKFGKKKGSVQTVS